MPFRRVPGREEVPLASELRGQTVETQTGKSHPRGRIATNVNRGFFTSGPASQLDPHSPVRGPSRARPAARVPDPAGSENGSAWTFAVPSSRPDHILWRSPVGPSPLQTSLPAADGCLAKTTSRGPRPDEAVATRRCPVLGQTPSIAALENPSVWLDCSTPASATCKCDRGLLGPASPRLLRSLIQQGSQRARPLCPCSTPRPIWRIMCRWPWFRMNALDDVVAIRPRRMRIFPRFGFHGPWPPPTNFRTAKRTFSRPNLNGHLPSLFLHDVGRPE